LFGFSWLARLSSFLLLMFFISWFVWCSVFLCSNYTCWFNSVFSVKFAKLCFQ
jgi:hypothetical protein